MYSLTLYIYPSPFGVNWKSPHHLTRSVIFNAATLLPRMIGHVSVELESKKEDRPERFIIGMSSNNDAENRRMILIEGKGLGVLFHTYLGHYETKDKLDPEKEKRLAKGNFSFVRFCLSEASYERVRLYLTEYSKRTPEPRYGFPVRPRFGEGGGCSAFATSFLEVAGVMQDEFIQHWSDEVRVPERFIENIPVLRLLWPDSHNTRWAEAHEPGRNLRFWDPDMMHAWVKRCARDLQSSSHPTMSVVFEKNTRGILVDSSKIEPTDESIWFV